MVDDLKPTSRYRRILRTSWTVFFGVVAVALCVLCVSFWRPDTVNEIHEKAKTFGERQLSQIINDRPAMEGILEPDEFIYRWVVQQFDANDSGERIYWNPEEPISGREAENQPAYDNTPASIRVSSSEKISGRDKWLCLIYELHNIKNAPHFERLRKLALAGEIDRAGYSNACLELEFKALVQTQVFFRFNPIAGATESNAPDYMGYVLGSSDFQAYKQMLDSDDPESYDPRDYFASDFDDLTSGFARPWNMLWNSLLGE